MTYEDDLQVRFKGQRTKQAIALAMQGQWREAITINQEIIESFPRDVESYNRLGRAYLELGLYSQARQAYNQSAELDPCNTIAKKNLQRLSLLTDEPVIVKANYQKVEPRIFIEEMGKASVVDLHNLAPVETQAKIVAGDKVYLKADGHFLNIETDHGEYLGQVDPRHGQRLVKLMDGGNRYTVAITSITPGKITVIIREVYQDPSQAGKPSFPPRSLKNPKPYVSEKMFKGDADYTEMNDESFEDSDDTSETQE